MSHPRATQVSPDSDGEGSGRGVLLGAPLPSDGIAWLTVIVVLTAVLRLLYPAAILLLGRAEGTAAIALVGASVLVSAARGAAVDRATRVVRRTLMDVLARAISQYPADAAGRLSAEQVETQISRGEPWAEALICASLPTLLGNVLALPFIAWAAAELVGGSLAALGGLALVLGSAVGGWLSSMSSRMGQRAWGEYQRAARLIEAGIRGRFELQAHGLGERFRERLMQAVERWSRLERAGFLVRAVTGWAVPAVAAGVVVMVGPLVGVHVGDLLRTVAESPKRDVVLAGLLAAAAVPILWGVSHALSDISAALPYWYALDEFQRATRAVRPLSNTTAGARCVDVEGVSFRYQPADRFTVSAHFKWAENETLAVVGPNGSGKTTLAWLLLGLLRPTDGQIRISLDDGSTSEATPLGRIGYLAQTNYFDDLETVRSAIGFVAPEAGEEPMVALLRQLIGPSFDRALLERAVSTLSAGQKRTIALARVLLRGSFLTILDEPEANLDAQAQARVLAVLRGEMPRRRFLLITHDPEFVKLADRTLNLSGQGAVSDSAADPQSQSADREPISNDTLGNNDRA